MEREKSILPKLCFKCEHKSVCGHIANMKCSRSCDFFKDEALVLILPCQPGTTVYRVEKDCDACSRCQQAYYSDCVTCADDHNLYDPVVQSDICRLHVRFTAVDFKPHMIDQIGTSIFLSPEDFWAKSAAEGGKRWQNTNS